MFDVYKPSGSTGTMTYVLAIVGAVIAILLAFVYQFLLDWIPFIYVSFLLTIGFGTIIGMVAAFIVNKGHCRNVAVAGLLGLGIATMGLGAKYGFQYPAWVNNEASKALEENQLPEADREKIRAVLFEKVSFADHLRLRSQQGWSIGRGGGGLPIQGVFVYLIWLIEAGIVYYFGWKLPTSVAREPYSEKTNQWADEAQVVMTLPITDEEMVSKIMTAASVDQLLEIPIPKTDESTRFAIYTVNSIPGQELEDAYLSVTSVAYSINNKGEQETKELPLVKHAILSSQKREQLIENAELLQEAMAEFRASKVADQGEEGIEPTDEVE